LPQKTRQLTPREGQRIPLLAQVQSAVADDYDEENVANTISRRRVRDQTLRRQPGCGLPNRWLVRWRL